MSASDKTLLIYGIHAAEATLTLAAAEVLEMWIGAPGDSSELDALASLGEKHGLRVQRVQPEVLDRLTGGAVHQGVLLRRRSPRALNLADYLSRVQSTVRAPTLVVISALDQPDILTIGSLLEHGIPGARRVVIDDAAHLVNLERPEALAAMVLPFLAVA